MSARFIFGDSLITPTPMAVATAQAVEVGDLVGLAANTIVRASDTTWGTAHTAPAAPTLAEAPAAGDTALTNALTGVLVSAQFPWGEGIIGTPGTVTPTAARRIKCTLAALPTHALYWNVYVEDAAGSGVYKLWRSGFQGSQIIYIDAYGAGPVPYAGNQGGAVVLTGALQMTQYAFAKLFVGCSNQRKVATVAQIFGNNGANLIMINRGGRLVVEFDCASASFTQGQFVAPAKASGNALEDQKVALAEGQQLWSPTSPRNPLAIGKVVQDTTSSTKVWVELLQGLAS